MISLSVIAGLAALIVASLLFKYHSRPSLSMIRGPKSPSFIFGNLLELFQGPIGEAEFAWHSLYGNVVRFKSVFGVDELLVTDPKALQKIFNTSAYNYPKLPNHRIMAQMLQGKGIISAEGEDHKRHRKIMLPGFGPKESRALFPIFKACAQSLGVNWLEAIGNSSDGSAVIDVHTWLERTALDAIGQAAFDVQFNTIQNNSHPLAKVYQNFIGEIFGRPPPNQILSRACLEFVPTWIVEWMTNHSRNPRFERARRGKSVSMDIARELVREKADSLLQGKGNRDVFTLLVRANMDADAKNKLNEEELLAQMSTILLAGHETTANSVSWVLLELARNPEVQSRLRDEIWKTEASVQARNDPQLTAADLDGMTYLNAVIKEALRFHPVNPHVKRVAGGDDILSLSKPILTRDGYMIDEVLVPKGTILFISIAAYNRDKDLWGKDVHVFNPDRWLDDATNEKKSSAVGVYSNLLTFLSGTRACIGWRFAVVEMQAFIVELVGRFEFALTDKAKRISRPYMPIMSPTVDGEPDSSIQLPLVVSPASRDDPI